MASIYILTEEFKTIWALMEDGSIDDEALLDVFNNTQEELADKMEGYCKFLKNCESDIEGLKAEIKRLTERKQVMENTVKRAKKAMQTALEAAGEKSITGGTFKISIAKNPPSMVIDDPYVENIPMRYLIPTAPTIDKSAIMETLKNGSDEEKAELEGIAHLEQGSHISIK